jgi:hypothetical protein
MGDLPADAADRLYTVPPERFVAAREVAVAAARRAGQAGAADELSALRRPTVAAWMVNQLVRHRRAEVEALLRLGDELRTAQRRLRGDDLRRLGHHRREAVTDLVLEARELALAAGPRDRLPLAEVEQTLVAALCDPEAATALRSARLTRTLTYTGFGEVPRPRLQVIAGSGAEQPGTRTVGALALPAGRGVARIVPADDSDAGRIAHGAVARAEAELAEAELAEERARQARDALGTALAELVLRHAAAQQELARAELARRAAERALGLARRGLDATGGDHLTAARRG